MLLAKGMKPSDARSGFVDGYGLRIGERATLLRLSGARVYGVVMELESDAVAKLYTDDSVADYVPELVTVDFTEGEPINATCYNLPKEKISGTNPVYAKSLLKLATNLDFPEPYLDQIRQAATSR